jgi:YHS domain-containing protein
MASILIVTCQATPAAADSTKQTPDPMQNIAIQGYDVVAYFTDGKPVKGSSDISVQFDDSVWLFTNASHKEMFTANPSQYMPQYGGLCAGGMALGVSVSANPKNWVIIDGKLYMVYGSATDLNEFVKNAEANIKAADANWVKLHQ